MEDGFLRELLDQVTVSGYEQQGASCIQEYMKQTADEIRVDEMGNVVCVLNPNHEFRVLVTAHLDEIGLMVSHITDGGLLQVIDRGGIIPLTYPGQQVLVSTGEEILHGVVASYREFFKKKEMKASDLLIDIGVDTKEKARALVPLGSTVVLDSGFQFLQNGRFCARALDDRLGVFIIMEAMKKAAASGCKSGIYCAATVGEETTKNGARWTASRVKPNLAVVVDVTYTSDAIGMNVAESGEVSLGGGPVLCNSPIVMKKLNKVLMSCAKRLGIEVQVEAASRLSYTDADQIHFSGDGIPVVLVSIPLRYMHHPAEMADMADVQGCIDLLAGFMMESEHLSW